MPPPSQPAQPAEPGQPHPPGRRRPAERYGDAVRPGRRRAARGALGLLATALLALLGWSAWVRATPEVRSGLIGYEVVSDNRVDVRFEVIADPQATVTCDVRAQNFSQETVGSASVVVPAGPSARREVRSSIRTRERAVNGELQACRLLRR